MASSDNSALFGKDLVRMCAANFLLSAQLFAVLALLAHTAGVAGAWQLALAVAAFAAGMYVPGPFLSFIVEAYARKKVCLLSILALALPALLLPAACSGGWAPALLFAEGAVFAVLQGVLGSTLLNDLLPSELRTRGDVAYAWAGRIGVPLGAAAGLFLPHLLTAQQCGWTAALAGVPAFLLVCNVGVPLKAPVKVPLLSADRFFQRSCWPMFLNILPSAALPGLAVGLALLPVASGTAFLFRERAAFFLFFAGGTLAALWAQRVVFRDADERAEMVSGLLLSGIAPLLLGYPETPFWNAAFGLLGLGSGLAASRFLMYFLKFCGHCQRGTAQNTFRLGWSTGFALGFGSCLLGDGVALFLPAVLAALSLLLYFFLTHPWFLAHRDRGFKFRGY